MIGLSFHDETEIKSFQWKEIRNLISYIESASPFYQRLFKNSLLSSSAIQDWADFERLPCTTKNDLQQYNWDFLCVDQKDIIEYTSTSGTLGKPVTIGLTKKDLARLAYNEFLSFSSADGSSSDLYQLMLTLDRQFMAGIAYYEGIRRLGAGLIRIGPGLPSMQWETIHRLSPTALVAVPSFIVKLLEFAKANNIDPDQSSVKKIICIGESIRTSDLKLNTIGQRISEQWNIQMFGTYASTEMQTAFTECVQGQGGHLSPELIYVELLDEEGRSVAPGHAGEVTITTLGVEGMPLLRYRTGDIARLHQGICGCGRKSVRLGPVEGRKQQMLKLKGTTIYPPAIFEVLQQLPDIKDFVIEAVTGTLGVDELRIHVVVNDYVDELNARAYLTSAFQSRLRVVPDFIILSDKEVEQLQQSEGTRKLHRFIDRREGSSKK